MWGRLLSCGGLLIRLPRRLTTATRAGQFRKPPRHYTLPAYVSPLYEMLSGNRAFEGALAASVIAVILKREPAPLDLTPREHGSIGTRHVRGRG
jgi:hypothetical protein